MGNTKLVSPFDWIKYFNVMQQTNLLRTESNSLTKNLFFVKSAWWLH
jgi:hypothetical protein